MNILIKLSTFTLTGLLFISYALSAETMSLKLIAMTKTAHSVEADKNETAVLAIQNHYNLTSAQVEAFRQKKMSTAHMIRASELSAQSGEPLSSILALRFDKRMSWSKLTKRFKVSESDIRSANASISREQNAMVIQQ